MNDPDYILHWLARPIIDQPYTLSTLIQQMHQLAESSDFSSTLKIIEKLKANSLMVPRLERAAIRLECALANWKMHNPSQAIAELQELVGILAGISLPDKRCKHLEALALWMIGALELQGLERGDTVERNWQKSLDLFKALSTDWDAYQAERESYYDRSLEMHQAIGEALSNNLWNPSWQGTILHCGRLESLEIHHSVPDEQFRLAGLRPETQGVITLQPLTRVVRIADSDFQLKSLRSPNELLILDSSRNHFVLKIASDGMDRIGLKDGDYLLLRDQRQAESGDIVLVEFIPSSLPAGLYTFIRHNGRLVFTPQSSKPDRQIFEFFSDEEDRYFIHGVVLGVFKPFDLPGAPSHSEQIAEEKQSSEVKENETPAREQIPIPIGDFLQTFPVYEKIPAGGPDVPPVRTGDYLELDRFVIQDKVYRIKNLRNGRRIRPRCSEVMILKVSGDSMNLAGIDDGDYIFLCLQDHARHNDIVAAQISNLDPVALLKRYIEYNDHFILRPESTNPAHQEKEFEKRILTANVAERKVYVRGVAVAVLKPVDRDQPE